jgi:hypothetical protein
MGVYFSFYKKFRAEWQTVWRQREAARFLSDLQCIFQCSNAAVFCFRNVEFLLDNSK